MKSWLLLFISLPAFAQISFSTNTINYTMRQGGPSDSAKEFQINGTGNITLASCVNNTPGAGIDPCSNVYYLVTYNPAATAPTVARVSVDHYYSSFLVPPVTLGAFTLTFTGSLGCVGSCALRVNVNLIPQIYPTFISPSGSFTGCSNSDAVNFAGGHDLDTCIMQGGYTPGPTPFNMFVGLGRTYSDPNFGGTVRQVTENPPAWHSLPTDSTNTALNSDGTLVFVGEIYGAVHIVDTSTGQRLYYTDASWGADMKGWDPRYRNIFYYVDPNHPLNIHKVTLGAPPTVTSDVIILSYPPGPNHNTFITNSNNSQVSKDGWWVFNTSDDNNTILVNLNTNPATVYKSPTWTTPWIGKTVCGTGGGGGSGVTGGCDFYSRLAILSYGINTPDNKRYFMVQFFDQDIYGGYTELYSLTNGANTIVDEGDLGNGVDVGAIQPDTSRGLMYGGSCDWSMVIMNRCMGLGHQSMAEVNGVQYWVGDIVTGAGYTNEEAMIRIDKKKFTGMPAENGGGTTIILAFGHGLDQHVNCASNAPVCVFAPDISYFVTAYNITSAPASGPITITTDNAYPGANGDSILVGGMSCDDSGDPHGNYNGNGVRTVSNLSGTSLDINATANCTWLNRTGYGSFIPNIQLTGNTYPHHNEVMVIDISQVAARQFTINRVAKARSEAIGDGLVDTYYGEPHPVISANGSMIAFESNNGTPSVMAVFTMPVMPAPVGIIPGPTKLKGVNVKGVNIH